MLGSPCSLARCFLCFLLCCLCLCCLRLSCLRLRLPRPSHGLRDPLPFLPRASPSLIGDRRRPVARSPGVTSSCSHPCFLARTNMQATGWGRGLSSWAPAVGRCGAAAHNAWRQTTPGQRHRRWKRPAAQIGLGRAISKCKQRGGGPARAGSRQQAVRQRNSLSAGEADMLFTNLFQKHGFRRDYHRPLRSRCIHAIFVASMPR